MSFILLAADWPNTSLQAAIKEGLMSSSPMEQILNRMPSEVKCQCLKVG